MGIIEMCLCFCFIWFGLHQTGLEFCVAPAAFTSVTLLVTVDEGLLGGF